MTRQEYDAKMEALGPMDDETKKRVTCAIMGHSHIVNSCFGQITCARCGEIVGDTLLGMYYDPLAVLVGHNCPDCRSNYERLGWESKVLTPYPFTDETEEEHDAY